VAGIQINEGHYGKIKLDGLRIAAIFKWPKAIHEGNCEAIAFVDEKANAEQREALLKIMTGKIPIRSRQCSRSMLDCYQMNAPVFTKIDLELDIDGRRGRIFVQDYIDTKGEPIRNKATARNRVRKS